MKKNDGFRRRQVWLLLQINANERGPKLATGSNTRRKEQSNGLKCKARNLSGNHSESASHPSWRVCTTVAAWASSSPSWEQDCCSSLRPAFTRSNLFSSLDRLSSTKEGKPHEARWSFAGAFRMVASGCRAQHDFVYRGEDVSMHSGNRHHAVRDSQSAEQGSSERSGLEAVTRRYRFSPDWILTISGRGRREARVQPH